jgi:cellulose synthase/poly-beta-1,6-N-acetylglucosamine synthase-like glycosyltransferase
MAYAEFTFWVCLIAIVYTYLLYPLLLFQAYTLAQIWRDVFYLSRRCCTRARNLTPEELPHVSLIIPAHNEEAVLPPRITNLTDIDYPPDKLKVIFVSDGSTDGTNSILDRVEGQSLRKILLPARGGKANAMNRGVEESKSDILVFSDAATEFAGDTIRKLVRHFRDPRVGAVCGSLQFKATSESQQTEGVYWKYESMLRLMEARLGATLTASGALYAIRRECFRPLDPGTMIEDFVVPMNCRKAGYQVVYDPEAIATDVAASSVKGEFSRRVRLAVGSFKAFRELSRTPLETLPCLAFFSHKVLRWFLPFFLLGLLLSNIFLVGQEPYTLALAGQATFYFAALMGLAFHGKNPAVKFATLCYYLLAIHLAFAVGFVRLLLRRDQGVWQKVL